ncbi:unnamed protein product, partial [Pneumocystis jirovecii]
MYEKSLGQKSLWYGYLQIIPDKVDIPKFWGHEKNWLKGTEIEYIGGLDISELYKTYQDLIIPFIKKNEKILNQNTFTYDNFLKAISIIRSRAFEIDKFHGLGLVPFADIFNHTITKEHVHFQTFYEVCEYCGSSTHIDHTKHQNYDKLLSNNYIKNTFYNDTCDMVIYNSPNASNEIFNTYGAHGNDILLSRYGFAIPENKWDRISMSKTVEKNYLKQDRLLWWKLNGFKVSYQMGLFQKYFSKEDIKNYIAECNNDHNTKFCTYCQNNQYLFLQDSLFLGFPSIPSLTLIFFITLLSLNSKLFKKFKKSKKNSIILILNIIKLQSFLFYYTGYINKLKHQKYKTLLIMLKINKILLSAINNRLKKYNQISNLEYFISEETKVQTKSCRKHWTKIVLRNELNILNNTQKRCINVKNTIKSILKQKKIHIKNMY